jgi:glycosyltransferase involved in cell wall biosynthesis
MYSTPPVGQQRAGSLACLMDIGPAVHQRAGLSRYAERLASTMAGSLPPDMDLTMFYNRHSGHGPPASLQSLPTRTIDGGQYAWRLGVLASQIARVPYRPVDAIARSLVSPSGQASTVVYHATEHLLPRLDCASVLTIHDLIFEHLPQYHTRANRLFLQAGMPLFIRNATLIIAVSETTKRDVLARYGVDPNRVRVVYEGIDSEFVPAPDDAVRHIRAQYSQDAPYLLMVGAIEPRKNHYAAVEALARLREAGYPHKLLIAGAKGWMTDPIFEHAQRSAVADAVSFLDFVPQEDLPALYSAADVFLLPSWYEGFGFIALEAMACGTPVVCSNVGSLPEIARDAALMVAPQDIAGLVQSIRNVLSQSELRETLVRKGKANAARFRWSTCAQETIAVYREAVARGNH